MAYTPVPTQNVGDDWTATEHNTYIKDNFAAGVPDIFTAKGQIAVATAADAAEALSVGTNGYVLMADSSSDGGNVGMKWASPGGPRARLKRSTTLAVNSGTDTIVDYATTDYDTHTAVTTGASWNFDVPAGQGGYYLIIASVLFESSAAWAIIEQAYLRLYKNGTADVYISQFYSQVTATIQVYMTGMCIVSLADTDSIDVRVYQASGSAINIAADADANHIAIAKLA